jgi:hypothetical protein
MIRVTLTPEELAEAMAIGKARAENKIGVPSKSMSNPGEVDTSGGVKQHQCGAIAERAFEKYTGVRMDRSVIDGGDSGDFLIEVEGRVINIDTKNRWEEGTDWQIDLLKAKDKGVTHFIFTFMDGKYDVCFYGKGSIELVEKKYNPETNYGRMGLLPAINKNKLLSPDRFMNVIRARYKLGI